MKKWLIILLCVVLLLGVAGCKTEGGDTSSEVSEVSNVELVSFTEEKVTFSLPKGFSKVDEDTPLYVTEDYPNSPDNFLFVYGPSGEGENIFDLTKESYQSMMQEILPGFTIEQYERVTVSELPALKMKYYYTLLGSTMHGSQLNIEIDGLTYTLTYTYGDGDLKDSIDRCLDAVTVAK